MKNLFITMRMFLFLTLITGVVYPVMMTGIAAVFFPKQAGGSLIVRDGKTIGSSWIGQKFVSDRYFWSRPSSIDYNPLPSGGSNLGPTSAALLKTVDERRASVQKAHSLPSNGYVPQDLIFASASGLDPDIQSDAAVFQIERIAKARGLPPEAKDAIETLIHAQLMHPDLGFIGETRVNVLALNLALDDTFNGTRSK